MSKHGARTWPSCYRAFRTTQEKRQWFNAVDQGIIPRRSRNYKNLPNTWDDYYIAKDFKCWKSKNKIKKQWDNDKRKICNNCKFWYKYFGPTGSCNINDKDLEKKYGNPHYYRGYYEGGEKAWCKVYYSIDIKTTLENESCELWRSQKYKGNK